MATMDAESLKLRTSLYLHLLNNTGWVMPDGMLRLSKVTSTFVVGMFNFINYMH